MDFRGLATRIRRPVVFGAADGVTVALGLIVSLTGQPHAVFKAALGAGLASLVGMTAGQWLSSAETGFPVAAANGAAAFTACVLPALPYLAGTGTLAMAVSLTAVVVVAAVITLLRPERGLAAVAQTFGVLLLAALICAAASLI